MRQRLRFPVDQHLKVARGEVGDVSSLAVGHHGVHLHQRRGDAENYSALVRIRRRNRRLLPESNQRAEQDQAHRLHNLFLGLSMRFFL